MSLGRMELQVVCGKGRHLMLHCSKMGLVLKKEGLAFSLRLGKVGHISSRTRVANAGVGKCSFLVVQGLHSVSKEVAKVRPGVLNCRLFVPSANLQCELWEQLHMVNASENRCVHVEGKFCVV